ncbi:MAG: hypothetical protein KA968_01225 [Chitinophagaceae bacterium]|nr:hypothetical protein [Chitinophagaceae bacterium]MBP7108027.1 hypothetical protein [Chitinophagaceae bacterium]MBP7313817.1 hypothetical protein [Chitinophagaceae bacterium]HQX96486.1 hypothetical protein [Chitinophagaceae bacterium]HQZ49960.1 hypothetical protein [Chitinophagaceae bacterium]
MTTGEIQHLLFKTIKGKSIEDSNLAEEIGRLLDKSTDSAYRRIRGEKTLSLDELQTLCLHFKISIDNLIGLQSPGVIFTGEYLDKKTFRFEEYVNSLIQNLSYMNSFKEKTFYYSCKDLPIFHHYHFREIAAFKWFFWLKTYFQFPEFEKKKFNFKDHPDELFVKEQKVLDLYNQLPSVEIWNLESMNIFFRQIEFYRDSQVFNSDEDVYQLYESIGKMWVHLEKQASLGYKFDYNDPTQKRIGNLKMYFNEVLLGDNNMLLEMDGSRMSYVSHTTINFMFTRDEAFNLNMYNHMQNQMQRSTLISEVSERERARFFRLIREKIEHRKESLKV